VVALAAALTSGGGLAACGAVEGTDDPPPADGAGPRPDAVDGAARPDGGPDGGPDGADVVWRPDLQKPDASEPRRDFISESSGGPRDEWHPPDGRDVPPGPRSDVDAAGPDVDPGPCGGSCDDGDPCTADECDRQARVCVHRPLTGGSCEGPAGCGAGSCHDGRCVDFAACDDMFVCTLDHCAEGGVCSFEEVHPVDRVAPDFQMVDTNPYSATYGETFSLERLAGRVVVLSFAASGCEPCCVQGEAARIVFEELRGQEDVFLAAVDTRSMLWGGSPESIERCVTADSDGLPPLTSEWPYLRDNDVWQVWNHYCAENYRTVVIDAAHRIRYFRNVNFEDPPFRDELMRAIDMARRTP
jgi:peroxiredoxin